MNDFEVPKYEKNPGKNVPEEASQVERESDEDDFPLEDLLNMMEKENEDQDTGQGDERKKIFIKKDLKGQNGTQKLNSSNEDLGSESKSLSKESPVTTSKKTKSSITITKIDKNDEEKILREKHSGLRVVKSSFINEIELNTRLACDYGKFLKLTEIQRRFFELKDKDSSFQWFTVFVLGSKTESKSSAKGNSYIIWHLHDLNNLEKQQDISLFLFGNAFKTHWKSSEFEVFALVKPDLLCDSGNEQKNDTANKPNQNYYNNNQMPGKKPAKQGSGWNNFAAKKMSLDIKLKLSVRNESQLVPLGFSKDITFCQGKKQTTGNDHNSDQSQRCKNMVNLQEVPFCIFHCKQADRKKFGNSEGVIGKYSMNKPTNRFGGGNLFESLGTPEIKKPFSNFADPMNKYTQQMDKSKITKEIKAEILMSLNSNVTQLASPVLSNVVFKTEKKSDKEMLALLEGKNLDNEELRKIRLQQQAAVYHQRNDNDQNKKAINKLFSSKALLPNEATANR